MPKRKDLKSVLIIGSGPIIIGQACEFDYAGSQSLRSLREDGIQTILINSNPATIMTDPTMADHVYLKPLTTKSIIEILKEHPQIDAVLPTMGGQTALNLCSFCWSQTHPKRKKTRSAPLRSCAVAHVSTRPRLQE